MFFYVSYMQNDQLTSYLVLKKTTIKTSYALGGTYCKDFRLKGSRIACHFLSWWYGSIYKHVNSSHQFMFLHSENK